MKQTRNTSSTEKKKTNERKQRQSKAEQLKSDPADEPSCSGSESEDNSSQGDHQTSVKVTKNQASKGGGGLGKKAIEAARAAGPYFTEDERKKIHSSLLEWYDVQHRVLPWRRTPHSKRTAPVEPGVEPAPTDMPQQQFAYQVWVSEIMLQQTQVATVIPYFKRWVAKWPTVAELAQASIEEVNSLWAGLGYYRRAKYLLDGACHVVSKLGGKFPATAAELLSIPGVGPYTAAAIGSIAFDDPSAVVDGNVVRVVSRLRALAGDPTKLGAVHTAMAQEMLEVQRPGCFNQAVMELGATVCRPVNPDCDACPVSHSCKAHAQWLEYLAGGGVADVEDAPRVTNYPGKKEVKDKRQQSVAVCVLELLSPPAGGSASAAKAKRPRTMLDFALAAKAAKADGQQTPGGAAAGGGSGSTAALLQSGQRSYLMVQRPEGGLLSGLWEFPGVVFEGESLPYSKRQALVDQQLASLLGFQLPASPVGDSKSGTKSASSTPSASKTASPAAAKGAAGDGAGAAPGNSRVITRHEVGTYVHVFSHIKQTNYVEKLVVAVDDLEAFAAAAGVPTGQAAAEAAPAAAEAAASTPAAPTSASKGSGKGAKRKASGSAAAEGGSSSGGKPAMKLVKEAAMASEGLTTGPKKIFKLACGGSGSGTGGAAGKK